MKLLSQGWRWACSVPLRVGLLLAAQAAEVLPGSQTGSGVHPTVTAGCGLPEGQALVSFKCLAPARLEFPSPAASYPPLREVKPVLGSVAGATHRSANPSRGPFRRMPGIRGLLAVVLSNSTLLEVGSRRSFSSAPQCTQYEESSRFPGAVPAS